MAHLAFESWVYFKIIIYLKELKFEAIFDISDLGISGTVNC